ncbi:glycosyltransferase family 39 protein [Pannus brasiliensis CCIBt3594]|uniref:Glycosyltransferase family 39 protein n=1 Tax=Pannus brasiliensis CCIBt3594 TaxID=1427578 RepID=A0AAW9R0S2_9CHRO
MDGKLSRERVRGLAIVGLIWVIGALIDRLWFSLDHTMPAWDQSEHLNSTLDYWRALQSPRPFDGGWWREFWLLSPKVPPLIYILTAPFFSLFGISDNSATLVLLPFSALLLFSVYGLGVILFSVPVGLWAAFLCALLPGLYYYRLEFLLDFPLAAIVTFCFFLLTWWRFYAEGRMAWGIAIAFGVAFGCAFLIKQPTLFFLFWPVVWVIGENLYHRRWQRLAQIITALSITVLVFFPYYRTNWLLAITSGKRATVDSALIEGDPGLNSIGAWTYYFQVLPYYLSWVLLLVPAVGLLLSRFYWRRREKNPGNSIDPRKKWIWLSVFLFGGYFLSSLNINKDARYILPLVPTLSIILAVGLLSWRGRYGKSVRLGTAILSVILMLFNLFPLGGGWVTGILSPQLQHYPNFQQGWPHEKVIGEILKTSPYLRSTLGVLPSTPEINQRNLDFYGGKENSRVEGRQVGVREKDIEQDAGSLDWFVTKTGDQGSVPDVQKKMVDRVERGGDFQAVKAWDLPDKSTLSLYHRIEPSIEVKPFPGSPDRVELKAITVPTKALPDRPIPVTYTWVGPWEQLRSGLVLLTWQKVDGKERWFHDHGIAMGALLSGEKPSGKEGFQVIERTAMQPISTPGIYRLSARYLNRETGESYPIATNAEISIDPTAPELPAPQLDLVTQLRLKSADIGKGIKGIEPIFALTNRINQYDATQDYVRQADRAFSYRLQHDTDADKLPLVYGLAIAKVLQQDAPGAIEATEKMIELDPKNPYHYAYQGFVYLYDWNPGPASRVLDKGIQLNPDIEELNALRGVAALMGGNLVKAWSLLKGLIE